MTRRRLGAAAAVAGVLLGVALWLLLSGGGGGTGPGAAPNGAATKVSRGDTEGGPGAASGPAVGGPPSATPTSTATAGPGVAAEPPEKWTNVVCVLEDGTPLEGVEIGYLREDGSSGGISFGSECGFSPPASILRVRHPYADLVAAEGGVAGEYVRSDPEGWNVAVEADRVRCIFRDRAGTAHVLLVNARTEEPVENVRGLRLTYLFRGGALVLQHDRADGLGGWIPIPEGRLPDEAKGVEADPATVAVEFAMPGFVAARVPLEDIHGRMRVGVEPVEPDTRGEVIPPKGDFVFETDVSDGILSMSGIPITVHLRSTDTPPVQGIEQVLGLPRRTGKFALYGLPDGAWEIEAAATVHRNAAGGSSQTTVIRGKRAFEKRGAPVDLGKIELRAAGTVVLRVVDSAGDGIPQAWAVVVRPEEDPAQGRRLDLDEGGMVAVGDLEPGVDHHVLVKGLPRDLEQDVTAAPDAKPVEFRWPERLVACRITLLVDGQAVANADGRTTIPARIKDSPLPRDKGAWQTDGTFVASLVPGTYRFSAYATPKEGGDLALFAGEVTVPSGDAFETRVELKREGR